MTTTLNEQVISTLLTRRHNDTAWRAEVARGRSLITEPYAYRHLAWAWASRPWARVPLLRVCALACDHADLPNVAGQSFGRALAITAYRTGSEQYATKLAICQQLDLERAAQVWRSMCPTLEDQRIGFAWVGLLKIALAWDHPNTHRRRENRRRLLEDFYTNPKQTLTTPAQEA